MKIGEIKNMTADDDAQELDRYATLYIGVQKRVAIKAKKIADLEAACSADTQEAQSEMEVIEKRLDAFAKANRIIFSDKRKLKSAMASLGLQKKSDTVISDEGAVIKFAKENGYTDLYKEDPKVIKTAVKVRLEKGMVIPGAKVEIGENVNIAIAKHLLAEVESQDQGETT